MGLFTIQGSLPSNPVLADTIYFDGTKWVRLAIGTTGQGLIVTGGIPAWGAAGLSESTEQSLATERTGGTDQSSIGANVRRYAFATLLPGTYKYIKITAIQWSNGSVVAGNISGGVDLVDAIPPVSANTIFIAKIPATAQSGTSTTQKVNVDWAILVAANTSNGLTLGMWINPNTATATMLLKTAGTQNMNKTLTYSANPPPFDSTAWGTSADELSPITIFYKGYS